LDVDNEKLQDHIGVDIEDLEVRLTRLEKDIATHRGGSNEAELLAVNSRPLK
jgi:hypothetical protein